MTAEPDKAAYNRALYAKSARHRLARINHSRRQRGSRELTSLDETTLRVPL